MLIALFTNKCKSEIRVMYLTNLSISKEELPLMICKNQKDNCNNNFKEIKKKKKKKRMSYLKLQSPRYHILCMLKPL